MAFEGLSEKLNAVFKSLQGKGRLTEADVRNGHARGASRSAGGRRQL